MRGESGGPLVVGASQVENILEVDALVEALRNAFRRGAVVPVRHHHAMEVPGAAEATLLLMPAWQPGRYAGIKIVTVFPSNGERGLPSVMGSYVLISAKDGKPLALIDGGMLTLKRTAAASALAAKYLSRPDAARLTMIGTGALAPHLIVAHASVRPISELVVWGRDRAKAERLARNFDGRRLKARAAASLEEAVGWADTISCATLSKEPLVRGSWLRPGQHVDLVGGFTPAMREADDEAIVRARVYVDTYAGATKEAGDIVQPLADGTLDRKQIAGELAELAQGRVSGRSFHNQITLFKSVGTALEDLAAAELVFESLRR
ncbi:MAG: ornithine cyclodeaminase family protein [Azospirillum sp.]|nr:ornithine cyclodeaminase family protein [Azospirillum sp.]MCA3265313.1 ornithine cyclodeaminase family protein [Azospirillum sp.]MCZ8124494.1 ornithine cyclodeaminase family protein [Magnetospirillum sp.]